ncbi:LysR family transcriptional regulator [Limnobacter sp.]|uniref:LysR family transcriptional regulator n=1 Tax=Limnobacter sp. TaxID=2003368 RepID=UPI00258FD8FB|nr:LysR family transcriptional regulator [Limnobacter sp.]
MRLTQVDLNLFVVFEAIYTRRNLTRAAEVLCITQPAVSNALARMRKTFNDQLFVSTSRGMVPTPVAENIYSRVSEALLLLDSSVQESELFVPQQARKVFRLSMNDLTESLVLPRLTAMLEQEAPGVQIESYFTARRDLATELEAGAIDLAIDAPLVNDPKLRHSPLLPVKYVCMLRKDHPFKGDTMTMQQYLGLAHLHISSRRKGLGVVDTELLKLGHKRNIQMRVQHYLVAPLIAMRSDLALTGPEHLLQDYDARLIELPFELPLMEWHLYWHRSSDQDQANRWLRSRIAAALQFI